MARTRIAVLVGLLAIASSMLSASQYAPWLDDVVIWLTAVDQHIPGTLDAQLRLIRSWPSEQFDAALPNLKAFIELASHPGSRTLRQAGRRFSRQDIDALVGVVNLWSAKISSRHLFERAAMLHSDIAMLPASTADPGTRPSWQSPGEPRQAPRTATRSTILLIEDGQLDHIEVAARHWELARTLMDVVIQDPGRDDVVRAWYVASAAFMADRRHHAYAVPHLAHARQLFPKDPGILFFSGCLSEALASPDVQNAVTRLKEDQPGRTTVGSLNDNVDEAIAHFKRALDLKPDFPEARVRLGRVLAVRGRHLEAILELERGLQDVDDDVMRYYGNLFLGRSREALDRMPAARDAYQAAAALYPQAQSPQLALSQLSRRDGNRVEAHRAIAQVLALPTSVSERFDPWWVYYRSAGRHLRELFGDLHKQYRTDQ